MLLEPVEEEIQAKMAKIKVTCVLNISVGVYDRQCMPLYLARLLGDQIRFFCTRIVRLLAKESQVANAVFLSDT